MVSISTYFSPIKNKRHETANLASSKPIASDNSAVAQSVERLTWPLIGGATDVSSNPGHCKWGWGAILTVWWTRFKSAEGRYGEWIDTVFLTQ